MDVETYLKEKRVWHRFVEKPETIHTADAASASGIELARVTKSLILLDDKGNPVMAIIPGDKKLDFGKARKAAGASDVRLVPFSEAEKYSGYLPGATPMVCHRTNMKVLFDENLTKFESIFGGGGTRTRLLEMKTADVIRLNGAVVAGLT
jgi:Cys-tRNA(Pro) deacylase